MTLLYILSDGLFLLLYQVIQYRRKITDENLRLSFPEKSSEELEAIAKQYYRNLCDSIVETIKLFSISKAALDKRIQCNWEVFDEMTLTES